jgi:hypothetical protein
VKTVAVDGRDDTFTVGAVEDVVDIGGSDISGKRFSFTADGEQMLVALSSESEQSPFVDLVVGWTDGIEEEK